MCLLTSDGNVRLGDTDYMIEFSSYDVIDADHSSRGAVLDSMLQVGDVIDADPEVVV